MNKYLYQEENRYFGQIAGGSEKYGMEELMELGAENVKESYRGAFFSCSKEVLYKINLQSRLFSRILAPINKFKCHDTKYLYKKALEIQWEDFLGVEQTFGIFGNVSNSKITHSKYAMLCLKDAIADYFTTKFNQRPNVDTENPDVWVNLFIDSDFAIISIDTYGGAMHKRGYRSETVEAPMQETLAATILRLTNWDKTTKLVDPFCGSGTLLCEALMIASNIPPSFRKQKFGFMRLPDYDEVLFKQVFKDIKLTYKPITEPFIFGSDISERAIKVAKTNINNLPNCRAIVLKKYDFEQLEPIENAIIVCNPPYGIRMGEPEEAQILLKKLGDFLKQKCKNCTAFVYVGDFKLVKSIGLKPTWKKELVSGSLDGRLVKIEIY